MDCELWENVTGGDDTPTIGEKRWRVCLKDGQMEDGEVFDAYPCCELVMHDTVEDCRKDTANHNLQ